MHTKDITILGIMLGIIIILTTLEVMLMPLPILPPHVKPGLANIVIMYCVFNIGSKQAIVLNVLKALFVLLTRGTLAGLLSLGGGILSIAVIILLTCRSKSSYTTISVSGACAHNIGQFIALVVLLSTPALVYYLPVLIVSGIVFGIITGSILKIVMMKS